MDSVYKSYAEVVALCKSVQDNLVSVLHPETGFAPRIRQVCRDQISEYHESIDRLPSTLEEITLLRLEENTWSLLQTLMPTRKLDQEVFDTAQDLLHENPYTPTSTLAQAILKSSPLLSELLVIREWTQDTAPPPQPPEATTGYWKFTKNSLMQSLRSGNANRHPLVTHLDPDAVDREQGKSLVPDDASYEKSLVQSLYTYIRAGRLDDAAELSRKAQQPWRAASIRGSLLFQWKAIANESLDDPQEDQTGQGNRNRRLWKSACTSAALSTALPRHERILYAALTPSPTTAIILKSACRTWEDHLWAQLSIICEEKQVAELARLRGNFWEDGPEPTTSNSLDFSNADSQLEEEDWEREVVTALDDLQSVAVVEGPEADHPFHFTQLNIILNRTDSVLEIFAEGIQTGRYAPSSLEYAPLCRFFAHLCLFLRMIDISVTPLAEQVILEAYLQVLEAAGQRDLIALYAGALGDNAIERYALFLVSLELSLDSSERREALTKARDNGLDIDRVAIATAELTIEKAFEALPEIGGPIPSMTALQTPPSDAELFLLRSIEWTIFLESTYTSALEQANVILRYFLGSGRAQLAHRLLLLLPPELASFTEPDQEASEYLHYRQFFVIWDTFDRIIECQSLEASRVSREAKQTWLGEYKQLLEEARELVIKLLTSEWLVTDVEEVGGDQRRNQLIRIRQIYIPELIIRLHVLLFSSRNHMPENLKHCLELVNIVADSRYKLYEDFVNEDGRRLGDYLSAVRQAVLGGLDAGGSDPYRILQS